MNDLLWDAHIDHGICFVRWRRRVGNQVLGYQQAFILSDMTRSHINPLEQTISKMEHAYWMGNRLHGFDHPTD